MAASTSSVPHAVRSVAQPVAAGAAATAGLVYLAAADPSSSAAFPRCPVHAVTGWWCPGCGLTRAMDQLLHGDVAHALTSNALVIPVAALCMLGWAAWLMGTLDHRPRWLERATIALGLTLAAVAPAFMIVRNVALVGVPGG